MLAHPFDDGTASLVRRALEATADMLNENASAYRRLMDPIVEAWPRLGGAVLGPPRWPAHPVPVARFGRLALKSAESVARSAFSSSRARGLFVGVAAHGTLPLDHRPSTAFGLVLGAMAHLVGWVLPTGGAQRLSNALAGFLRSLGRRPDAGRSSSRRRENHPRARYWDALR